MATIVNTTPTPSTESNSNGVGFMIGMLVLLFAVFLFFYYGLPLLRDAASSQAPSVTVPDQIDVNVNSPSEATQPQPAQ